MDRTPTRDPHFHVFKHKLPRGRHKAVLLENTHRLKTAGAGRPSTRGVHMPVGKMHANEGRQEVVGAGGKVSLACPLRNIAFGAGSDQRGCRGLHWLRMILSDTSWLIGGG